MTRVDFSAWSSLAGAQQSYKDRVDEAAGRARQRFARHWLIDEEYWLTAQEAQVFAERAYADPVPETVQSWADAAGTGVGEAADRIIATRDTYNDALRRIRRIRLTAKARIDAADSVRAAHDAMAQAVADLDAVAPPAQAS